MLPPFMQHGTGSMMGGLGYGFAIAGLLAAGCGSGEAVTTSSEPYPPAAPDNVDSACTGERTLSCAFFDGTTQAWSVRAPTQVSLAAACAAGADHGELAAYVTTPAQYWLDRVGFEASGTAVRANTGTLRASDDAGGTTYGCGLGGGKVLTQLLCGSDVGAGTLTLAFHFAGRWSDGSTWMKDCTDEVQVLP
jgi:hypothetical protein